MDFFEKVGAKIAEAGTEVSKKAKEMSSVVSMKNQIRTEENKIEALYKSIGEKYFNTHKDIEGDIYAEDIASILAAKTGIETLKAQIQEIQGVGTCISCGAEINEGAAFCTKCGAKQE